MVRFTMLGALTNLFNSLSTFVKEMGKYVTFDYLLIGGLGLLLLTIIIAVIRTRHTYEVKLLKKVNKLNKYFAKNPYVKDDNIIELNNKMKTVPKTFRSAWQEYMLNRDKAPSEYMNTNRCIDQPVKSSAYKNTTTATTIFTVVISILLIILSFARMEGNQEIRFSSFFFEVFLLPILILVLGLLFVAFMNARHTSIMSDLYYSFHEFERNINKACTTMPSFIDYEVLFTKKEIKDGIPVLQDYLEKRAIEEKQEREEAELNASNFEYYDFDELGVENSLLLERAMKESEKYLNVKRELSAQVSSKSTEMYNYKKNFDQVTKDFERKAQASRESIQQLTEQINATTIKIEQNYMKKRLNEEQTKLQQMEKDYEVASLRFQKQQEEMQQEVDTFNDEIEKRRKVTQEAMMSECKNYANKVYSQISNTVQEQSKPYFDQVEKDKTTLENSITELKGVVEEQKGEIVKTSSELTSVTEQLNTKKAELESLKELKEYLTSAEFKQSFLYKNKNRTLDDGREVEVSDDVVKQIADLQDKVKLSSQNSILYQDKITLLEKNIESLNREVEQHKKAEQELLEKLKKAEEKASGKPEIKIPTIEEVHKSLDNAAKTKESVVKKEEKSIEKIEKPVEKVEKPAEKAEKSVEKTKINQNKFNDLNKNIVSLTNLVEKTKENNGEKIVNKNNIKPKKELKSIDAELEKLEKLANIDKDQKLEKPKSMKVAKKEDNTSEKKEIKKVSEKKEESIDKIIEEKRPVKIQPVTMKNVRAPRKKATLDSLLEAVTKIQNDDKDNK